MRSGKNLIQGRSGTEEARSAKALDLGLSWGIGFFPCVCLICLSYLEYDLHVCISLVLYSLINLSILKILRLMSSPCPLSVVWSLSFSHCAYNVSREKGSSNSENYSLLRLSSTHTPELDNANCVVFSL